MPKVSYTAAKGLIQETGSGFDLNGSKNSNILVRSATTAHVLTSTEEDLTVVYTGTMDGDVTLPQATAANAGMVIKLLHAVDGGNASRKIGFLNTGSTVMFGTIQLLSDNAAAAPDAVALVNNAKIIVRDANDTSDAGGAQGSQYTFTYLGLNLVHCEAIGVGAGGLTPASAAGASSATGI